MAYQATSLWSLFVQVVKFKLTGEPVRVEPVVVLPGWFVRITGKGNFPVKAMNANYLVRFLSGQTEIIPPAQVWRIITALDEKCRDMEF